MSVTPAENDAFYNVLLAKKLKKKKSVWVNLSAREPQLGRGFLFQQDNDTEHRTGSEKATVSVLERPGQIPDLSTIQDLQQHPDVPA